MAKEKKKLIVIYKQNSSTEEKIQKKVNRVFDLIFNEVFKKTYSLK